MMDVADDIDAQRYAAAIPPWCKRKTLREHMDMLYCWGLAESVSRGESRLYESCAGCELREELPAAVTVPATEP